MKRQSIITMSSFIPKYGSKTDFLTTLNTLHFHGWPLYETPNSTFTILYVLDFVLFPSRTTEEEKPTILRVQVTRIIKTTIKQQEWKKVKRVTKITK